MNAVKYSRCFLSEAENLVPALIARIYKTVSKPLVEAKLYIIIYHKHLSSSEDYCKFLLKREELISA